MRIGGHGIGEDGTFVIAEAGSNHDGSLDQAKELIDVAAEAGADAVKFQTFSAETMYSRKGGSVEVGEGERSLYDLVAEMEMPYEWIAELDDYCAGRGVVFMSTPLDDRAIEELDDHVPAFKVASSTLTHHPFLERLAAAGKPIVASTGAHTLDEARESLSVLREAGAEEVALLHCVSSYPTPPEQANVRAVATLADEFDVPVGYSDHTLDPTVAPVAAVALGATIVEKHFTLDRSLEGSDHGFALEPDELAQMVSAIRLTEEMLGDGEVDVQEAERGWYENARRSVQATTDIDPGAIITEENVAVLRSGTRTPGVAPKHYEEVLGAITTTRISEGDGVTWDDLE